MEGRAAAIAAGLARQSKVLKEKVVNALPKGQYVKHYRYGFGLVIDSSDAETSIAFETHGSKNFVTSLMLVELSDLTPPARFRSKWVPTAPALRFVRKAAPGRRARAAW